MPKKQPSGFIDPENLWAKPHPRPTKTQEPTRMDAEDEYTDDDIDVDAELEAADQAEEEYSDDNEPAEETDEEEIVAAGAEEVEDEIDDYEAEEGDEIVDDADAELEDDIADEGDVETETVVSTVDYDEVDEDTADDDYVAPAASTEESRKSPMAEKKKVSISDHVRTEIEKRKASGASLRGVDIVGALEKRGITVSPAQVSQLLKKAGVAPSKKGRRPAAATAPADEKSRTAMKASKLPEGRGKISLKRRNEKAREPVHPSTQAVRAAPKAAPKAAPIRGNATEFSMSVAQLRAARAFLTTCDGSFEKAGQILSATEQLAQAFND